MGDYRDNVFGRRLWMLEEFTWVTRQCDLGKRDSRCSEWPDDPQEIKWPRRRVEYSLRHLLWFGPERAAVRDSLTAALKDFRANDETDVVPPTGTPRGGIWGGGWID